MIVEAVTVFLRTNLVSNYQRIKDHLESIKELY
jgi:hypothetical protein